MSYKLADAAAKTGLPRQARALLEAICRHVHRPGQEWQVCHKEWAERAGYKSGKTVQRWLPTLEAGYLTRRGIYRDAHYYTVIDPALWPALPTATAVYLDKKSNVDKKSGQTGQDVQGITVFNPLEVTDVTSLPPGGDEKVTEEKPKADVICLDSHPRNPGLTLTLVADLYNRCCPNLRAVKKLDDTRRRALSARVREDARRRNPEWWSLLFQAVAANEFLNGDKARRDKAAGRSDRLWQADFDWLLSPTGLRRVVEGKYDQWQGDYETGVADVG